MADSITSLLGQHLEPPPVPAKREARLEAALAEARAAFSAHPHDADARIWLGRRFGYLGRFNEAIAVFTDGMDAHPGDVRFLRHRGHRLITVRRLGDAAADLATAAALIAGRPDEPEPDGQPSPRGVPTSTLHFNVWYHLGLARYLLGRFAAADSAWLRCLAVSSSPDMMVATTHWRYMTLQRMGRDDVAEQILEPITEDLDVVENGAYHRLCLMYRGVLRDADLLDVPVNSNAALHDSTAGYGIGNWWLYHGRPDEARSWFKRICAGPQWAAFGYIAAEAELARSSRL